MKPVPLVMRMLDSTKNIHSYNKTNIYISNFKRSGVIWHNSILGLSK